MLHLVKVLPEVEIDSECIQPNAVDIRIDSLYKVCGSVVLSKTGVSHGTRIPVVMDGDFYCLEPGAYQFESNTVIKVPDHICGWVIGRSSLNRNGVFVTSGLYDSGFNNTIGGTIYVINPTGCRIEKGARVAQFVMDSAQMVNRYNGQYNIKE